LSRTVLLYKRQYLSLIMSVVVYAKREAQSAERRAFG
jgi:hypothetical protein